MDKSIFIWNNSIYTKHPFKVVHQNHGQKIFAIYFKKSLQCVSSQQSFKKQHIRYFHLWAFYKRFAHSHIFKIHFRPDGCRKAWITHSVTCFFAKFVRQSTNISAWKWNCFFHSYSKKICKSVAFQFNNWSLIPCGKVIFFKLFDFK